MKENRTKLILQYTITFAICSILSFVYFLIFNIFSIEDVKEVYRILCNGFFCVGIICACFGALIMISYGGAFDFIAYGIMRFFTLFKRKPNDVKYQTYFDYHTYKAEQEHDSVAFMLVVGLLFVAISLFFIPGFYNN